MIIKENVNYPLPCWFGILIRPLRSCSSFTDSLTHLQTHKLTMRYSCFTLGSPSHRVTKYFTRLNVPPSPAYPRVRYQPKDNVTSECPSSGSSPAGGRHVTSLIFRLALHGIRHHSRCQHLAGSSIKWAPRILDLSGTRWMCLPSGGHDDSMVPLRRESTASWGHGAEGQRRGRDVCEEIGGMSWYFDGMFGERPLDVNIFFLGGADMMGRL